MKKPYWEFYKKIVCPGNPPYLFIHINKTAGTAILKALNGFTTGFHHLTVKSARNKVTAKEWDESFKFSIVRNPWDRVVSKYFYRVSTNQHKLRENPINFKKWVIKTYEEKDPFYYNNTLMFLPQTEWLKDEMGNISLFIGKFENLENDFQIICNKLNKKLSLPKVKVSRRNKDYRTYYDNETTEIIYKWFLDDINYFNYTFE